MQLGACTLQASSPPHCQKRQDQRQSSPDATAEGFLRDTLILQSSILVLLLIQLLLKLLAKQFMQTDCNYLAITSSPYDCTVC